MRKKIGWFAAGVLALATITRAAIIVYNAPLVAAPALAYNNTYSLNLLTNGIGALSAQATYSSATISNATFTDGTQSTGGFTVSNFAALSTAPAVDNITVVSTTGLSFASINVPGYVFTNGIDWATRATTALTAQSLGAALATVPYLSVSVTGSVVYATTTVGAVYNSYAVITNNANLTVATPRFTGGQDNAVFKINGVPFTANRHWSPATSNVATAASIATAINGSPSLSSKLRAQASGAVVTATSTLNGSVYNYLLQTSTPTALSASASNMTGGTNAGFALASNLFTASNGSGLSLALPVLYTGSPAIGGLSAGTTYYAVPVTGNSFQLSGTSTGALAGTGLVVITSTNTQLSANTYTLSALPITGTPSFKWQFSNDNTNWVDMAVSSVTVSSYANPPASTLWSFGYIGAQYLRLNVVAPTTGALNLNVIVVGTN